METYRFWGVVVTGEWPLQECGRKWKVVDTEGWSLLASYNYCRVVVSSELQLLSSGRYWRVTITVKWSLFVSNT